MSSSTIRNRRTANRILKFGQIQEFSCSTCFRLLIPCVKMPRHVGCAECSRNGHRCVDVSWDQIEKAEEKVGKQLEDALDELERSQAKVARLRKVLRQVQGRAEVKMTCIQTEIAEEADARFQSGEMSGVELQDYESNRSLEESLRELSQMSTDEINTSLSSTAVMASSSVAS